MISRYSDYCVVRHDLPQTVDLIDGEKLCESDRDKEIGLRIVPQVDQAWFDRFDIMGWGLPVPRDLHGVSVRTG